MRRFIAALALAGLVGCGGLGPGDIEVYRVGVTQAESQDADCQGNEITTTTFLDGGLWALMAVDEDGEPRYLLDMEGTVLDGVETDEGYSFSGVHETREDIGPDSVLVQTADLAVDVIADGSQLTGSVRAVVTIACEGDCAGFDSLTCTANNEVVGARADEAVEGAGSAE